MDLVEYNLSQGESRESIRNYLISEGLNEEGADEIFALVPKPVSFWHQLPIYPYFAALDERAKELPARVIWSISGILILIVIVIGLIVYVSFNPKNIYTRDQERDAHHALLVEVLDRYKADNGRFPGQLSELVPGYLQSLPVDPRSNSEYGYTITGGGRNYFLCIYFESKKSSQGCLSTSEITAEEIGGFEN